jgi:hypothetical protein
MNLGAQNGNAWLSAGASEIFSYNLGKPDGIFQPTAGNAGDTAANLTGATGAQVYSNTFDLSTYTPPASNTVAGYDFIVLGFAREIGGTTLPEVTIQNIVLSVPGGDTVFEFVREVPANDFYADPDFDTLNNLYEYALGGNPTNDMDMDLFPTVEIMPDGTLELVYRRRVDAVARDLTYTVQRATNLVPAAVWSSTGITEMGTAPIDSDFESVTNHIQSGEPVFGRLEVSLEE